MWPIAHHHHDSRACPTYVRPTPGPHSAIPLAHVPLTHASRPTSTGCWPHHMPPPPPFACHPAPSLAPCPVMCCPATTAALHTSLLLHPTCRQLLLSMSHHHPTLGAPTFHPLPPHAPHPCPRVSGPTTAFQHALTLGWPPTTYSLSPCLDPTHGMPMSHTDVRGCPTTCPKLLGPPTRPMTSARWPLHVVCGLLIVPLIALTA